jgi:hypothetical protein
MVAPIHAMSIHFASVVKEELAKHRGTQFDSRIVDRVLASDLLDRLYPNSGQV